MKKLTLLLLYLITLVWLPAQTATTALEAMDIAKLQTVNSVTIHPDGQLAAYTVSVPADPMVENKPAVNHLYLLDPESGQSRPMVTTTTVRSVAFRPLHGSLTFLAKRPGDEVTRLYEISLSGGEAQPLYTHQHSISDYNWAPDGQHLAFYSSEPTTDGGKENNRLPYSPEIYEENLSETRGYVVDMETARTRLIVMPGSISDIVWSPDGARLAVAAAPSSLVDDYYMNRTVRIVNAKSLKVMHEIDHKGKLGGFAFSPNGEQLAMIAAADLNDPIDGRLLWVKNFDEAPVNLRPDFPGMFEDFSWSGNDEIVFLASQGVYSVLGSINPARKTTQTILEPQSGQILESFDRADDGTFVFTGSSAEHPSEVYVYQRGIGTPERVTHHNTWLKDKKLGKQERIIYQARDGERIEGILIYPVDHQPGRRYPLITVVHGGPESHYDNSWLTGYSMPGQMAAGKGYLVFYPNYRGSTGRGEAFAKSSQGDLAGKEFDDIVDGVDYLIEQGWVDKAKVGVTGGSYGGYATGWLSTRYTDRFAAGVMFVGISNNISKWGTSDIPEELFHVHARKRVFDAYEFFLERSPIFYAGQAKTPLLIMAGKDDTRVHPSQSMELYRHIKTRTETPVRLVLYPGEGHGNRNAAARLDYSLRMLRWFDRYLKNDQQVKLDPKLDVERMNR